MPRTSAKPPGVSANDQWTSGKLQEVNAIFKRRPQNYARGGVYEIRQIDVFSYPLSYPPVFSPGSIEAKVEACGNFIMVAPPMERSLVGLFACPVGCNPRNPGNNATWVLVEPFILCFPLPNLQRYRVWLNLPETLNSLPE